MGRFACSSAHAAYARSESSCSIAGFELEHLVLRRANVHERYRA
jgi:hypothetical protein